MATKDDLPDWVVDALNDLGGRARLSDLTKLAPLVEALAGLGRGAKEVIEPQVWCQFNNPATGGLSYRQWLNISR